MVATERLGRVTGRVEAPGQKSALGRASDLAGRNASEARAGLESEVVDADPPVNRGRPRGQGRNRHAPVRSAGVLGTACREGDLSNWGRSGLTKVAASTLSIGRVVTRKSERVAVPRMPGNAGGGKDPHFRC